MLYKLIKLAKKYNVDVIKTIAGRWTTYEVWAPDGFSFVCEPGLHVLVAQWITGSKSHREVALQDLVERLEFGIEKESI